MFKEAESVFESLLNEERSSFKPDQKMFHMMIYMYKKAGNYDQARRTFALMDERRIPQSTVTYNSLMSFETDYKEVSRIYDKVHYIYCACLFFYLFRYPCIADLQPVCYFIFGHLSRLTNGHQTAQKISLKVANHAFLLQKSSKI